MAGQRAGGRRSSLTGWLALTLSICSVGLVALAVALRAAATPVAGVLAVVSLSSAIVYFLGGLVAWGFWRRQQRPSGSRSGR